MQDPKLAILDQQIEKVRADAAATNGALSALLWTRGVLTGEIPPPPRAEPPAQVDTAAAPSAQS